MVRRRLLGPRRLHDADVDDHRDRLRRRNRAAGLRDRAPDVGASDQRPQCRGVRRAVLDAGLARLLELQPDLQRAAGSRGRAASEGIGLSRDRRGGLSRRRQRVGARPVLVSGPHHGGARLTPRCDREDQRRDPIEPDARIVAKHADRGGAHPRLDGALLLLRACRRRCPRHDRDGRHVSARDAERRQGRNTGRVARVQPDPDGDHLHARLAVSHSRGHHERRLGDPRAEPLRLPVSDRRHAAPLAAAVVRAGDRGGGGAGRRRADSVSALRRHRAHDDRVGHRHRDGALLRRRVHAAHLPDHDRDLLGVPRPLHSISRRQMVDRSALHARGRKDAARAPRVGRANLQRHRSARQSHSPVLDAAARRHPRPQGSRHRRLLDAPVRRSRSARAVPGWALNYTLQYVPPVLP